MMQAKRRDMAYQIIPNYPGTGTSPRGGTDSLDGVKTHKTQKTGTICWPGYSLGAVLLNLWIVSQGS